MNSKGPQSAEKQASRRFTHAGHFSGKMFTILCVCDMGCVQVLKGNAAKTYVFSPQDWVACSHV